MHRIAFTMQVDPAHQEEYIKRHNPIWEELDQALSDHGVTRYSIFIDPRSGVLFAYAEVESVSKWHALAETDVCRRWWSYMSGIMPPNADGSLNYYELKEAFRFC